MAVSSESQPAWGHWLVLHPSDLHAAYWKEHSEQHRYWDFQVACWCLLPLVILTMQHLPAGQATASSAALGPAWAVAGCWVLLINCFPDFYSQHRAKLLVSLRLALSAVLLHSSSLSSSSSSGSSDGGSSSSSSSSSSSGGVTPVTPAIMLLLHLLVFMHVHVAAETLQLMLPFAMQLLVTAVKPLVLLFGGVLKDLIVSLNTRESLSVLHSWLLLWARLVQSGSPQQLSDSDALAGRSCTVLLTAALVYCTTVSVTMYVYYMQLWTDTVYWIVALASRRQRRGAGGTTRAGAAGGTDGARDAGTVWVGDVGVQSGQLVRLCRSPASALLLRRPGWVAFASWVCLHGCAVNMLCLACWYGSQVLVRRWLPGLLSEAAMDVWYPRLPEV